MTADAAAQPPIVQRTRAASVPPWLLFPVVVALARISVYAGDLWWLMGPLELLLDVTALFVLLRLVERFPVGRRHPWSHLWPYAVAAAVYTGADIALQSVLLDMDPEAAQVNESLLHAVLDSFTTFLIWIGLAHTVMYLRRYRGVEADSLRLRLDLAGAARKRVEAELRSFENEVNPRFLLGALRSAATHVQSDRTRSERLLVEIGDVVRAARPASPAATLGDEIAALTPFIALEQSRLNREITLTANVGDDLLDEPLPPLVLPTLVREALRTASGSGGPIIVDISAARGDNPRGDHLQVDVSCAHLRPEHMKAAGEDGVLARTIDHLRSAYAGEAAIDVTRTDSGVRVRLTVPLERSAAADPPPAGAATRSRVSPILLAVWFVALLAVNLNTTMTLPRANGELAPPALAIAEAVLAASWLTLILYVAIRLTRRGFGGRMLAVHASAAVGLGLVNAVAKWVFVASAGHPYPPHEPRDFVRRVLGGVTTYGLIAAVIGAFEYARRYRSAELKGLGLQAELAEAERRRIDAELRALKAELNPHFLGNALTGASSLMRSDPAAARDVLTRIADVVGSVVARVGTQEVTLAEEIEGLAPFIAVEQSRFGDRLAVSWNVDPDARGAHVPHLILQPLLENAVKHGLASAGGRIVVAGRRAGDHLELSVRDNGVGLEQARRAKHTNRGGIGLANSRARLEQLYGGAATLRLEPAPLPEPGTVVRVTLPWR